MTIWLSQEKVLGNFGNNDFNQLGKTGANLLWVEKSTGGEEG